MIRPGDWGLLVALNLGIALAPGVASNASHPGVTFRAIGRAQAQAAYALLCKPSNRNPAFHAFSRLARDFAHRRDPPLSLVGE
jgi:hypothetical protein